MSSDTDRAAINQRSGDLRGEIGSSPQHLRRWSGPREHERTGGGFRRGFLFIYPVFFLFKKLILFQNPARASLGMPSSYIFYCEAFFLGSFVPIVLLGLSDFI